MKTLPIIAATSIALALLLVPLAATAAGTLTITSPASGASYKGSQAYSIAGTISPAPTQADNVGIIVSNPNGATVDQGNAAVASGAWSYSTAVGGTAAWVGGTYTITATDTFGATGKATFTYSATTAPTYNVTRALLNIQGNQSLIIQRLALLQKDLNGNFTALATADKNEATALSTITTNLGSLSTAVSQLTTNLGSLSTAVSQLQSSVTSIGTQVGTINTNVNNLATSISSLGTSVQNAVAQATNAANAASSAQTYVLVVAVLAAITLVLELAILVRKLS